LKAETGERGQTYVHGESATFSPDGKRIVFTAGTEWMVDSPRFDLYAMSTDGANLRRLAQMPRAFIKCLRWHPRTARLLSVEEPAFNTPGKPAAIWLRNADGKVLKKLADVNRASPDGADWSPDGAYIVFQVAGAGLPKVELPGDFGRLSKHCSIWAMKSDGTGKYKIVDDACHPNWRKRSTR
jgi:Tol biopolymer transport system component